MGHLLALRLEQLADSPLPTTYAGGIRSLTDIARLDNLSGGRLDFTVGSALDIFGEWSGDSLYPLSACADGRVFVVSRGHSGAALTRVA